MVVVAVAFAACGGSATSTPPPPTSSPDSGFGLPAEPNAIFLTPSITPLTNQGTELHHQQLIKLPEGMTTGDFMAVLAELPPDAPPPPGVEMAGGVSVIAPGVTGTTTLDLMAGNYMMVCFVPNAEGIPHVALGMALPITVTGSEFHPTPRSLAAKPPEPTVSMDMVEFGFELSGTITSGPQVIQANNTGAQDHEFLVVQLEPGATVEVFLEAVETGGPEPPPGRPLGGLQAISPGGQGFVTIDFAPGNYALVCGLPDGATGAPHFALGMLHQFTVQ